MCGRRYAREFQVFRSCFVKAGEAVPLGTVQSFALLLCAPEVLRLAAHTIRRLPERKAGALAVIAQAIKPDRPAALYSTYPLLF